MKRNILIIAGQDAGIAINGTDTAGMKRKVRYIKILQEVSYKGKAETRELGQILKAKGSAIEPLEQKPEKQ